MSRGIVYVAVGSRHLAEAAVSIASARRWLPGVPIALFTDTASLDRGLDVDEVHHVDAETPWTHLTKLECLARSPYLDTLYLDTDTYLCGDSADLFDLLGRFDLAMTLERRYDDAFPLGTGIPDPFREFNQGVVSFRRSPAVAAALTDAASWGRARSAGDSGAIDDQFALRRSIWRSDLRVVALTPEYNCRFHAFGYLVGPVRILHGRVPGRPFTARELERVAARLNADLRPRVFAGGSMTVLRSNRWGVGPDRASRRRRLFATRRVATTAVFMRVGDGVRRSWREGGIDGWRRRATTFRSGRPRPPSYPFDVADDEVSGSPRRDVDATTPTSGHSAT
jgi:hypothetical protein